MNQKFFNILSEYIPASKTGGQFEGELKKINLSRQELSVLFGVPVNTLARKFNNNCKHYKKKQNKVIEEWALYGIKCAIRDIEQRAEEVKNKKLQEAKGLVNYVKGNLSNKDIILAEKRTDILQALRNGGSNIKEISSNVGLCPTTVLKHILNDEELLAEFGLKQEEDALEQMENLKGIANSSTSQDKDRISAAKEILKNTKSKILDKTSSQPNRPIAPNSNFFINNVLKKKSEQKKMKELIIDENGEEFVIIDNENEKIK